MRGVCLLLFLTAVMLVAVPAAAAVTLTIDASPKTAHIGDTIVLNGTINGSATIAVFLFLTGDHLDTRGVALDNLNIPAGRGMFTTAPVQLADKSWTYTWDTSAIIGTLEPGKYTVYVTDRPMDRLRFTKPEYATAEIEFLPPMRPVEETPLDPPLPVAGLICAAFLLAAVGRKQ
ncbi:hypothetical protein [Methanoregula formicica]|uniref:DUF3821 domain-containing protein n=1 Tax=Methanoregula formicica (strain DSM 22288 / NBRC 105244 / SMSP) TaxID=593750 RepID=L0HF97_METFS|nr:hypothetical protein [Methanoregula formicica]AGB01754.1 hypothetical protein Metfor_0694 [Methanoregula formicica SMSP]